MSADKRSKGNGRRGSEGVPLHRIREIEKAFEDFGLETEEMRSRFKQFQQTAEAADDRSLWIDCASSTEAPTEETEEQDAKLA